MRILPFLPSSEGHEPIARDFNHDLGRLDIYHPSKGTCIESSKVVPDVLILTCEMKPCPILNKSIHVQLIAEQEPLEGVLLYAKDSVSYRYDREIEPSQWEGISIHYLETGQILSQGKSFSFQGKNLPIGKIACEDVLYYKPFAFESLNPQERQTTLSSHDLLTSPPGVLNTRVLRGYGGYYKPGIPPEEVQQIYYSLSSAHSQTRIRLYSSSKLKETHTLPPQGGRGILFDPCPLEEEYLSLSGALARGYATLSVTNESEEFIFKSFDCKPIADSPHHLHIFFKP